MLTAGSLRRNKVESMVYDLSQRKSFSCFKCQAVAIHMFTTLIVKGFELNVLTWILGTAEIHGYEYIEKVLRPGNAHA